MKRWRVTKKKRAYVVMVGHYGREASHIFFFVAVAEETCVL